MTGVIQPDPSDRVIQVIQAAPNHLKAIPRRVKVKL